MTGWGAAATAPLSPNYKANQTIVNRERKTTMLEMLEKMFIATKGTLAKEYGERFTSLSEEVQAGVVLKVMADLVNVDPLVSKTLAERYLKEIS